MLEPPQHNPMQAIHMPHTSPIQAPYRPLKGEHRTGKACVGGRLAGHLVHILSPLVGHYTHDTHALSSKGPPASPKPQRPTAPNPPFQNTLVHPTTTTPPHHHNPAAPTTDIPPPTPRVNLAGQGQKGGRPCRCRCSASKVGPRRPHGSLYSASPARDARRSQAAKPAGQRRGEKRGPNIAVAG